MYRYLTSGACSDVYVDHVRSRCKKETFAGHDPHNVDRELAILKHLRDAAHPNIIQLIEHSIEEETGTICMEFEYYEMSILDFARQQGSYSQQVINCLKDICSALSYVHSQDILHRDVHPNNIVIDTKSRPMKGVLIDFGISWSPQHNFGEHQGNLVTSIGTSSFRAPELLFGFAGYGKAVDLWALGCTVAQVCSPQQIPLFAAGNGQSDLGLLASIFQSLGTPSTSTWQDASVFPSFDRVEFTQYDPKPWTILLPDMPTNIVGLIADLVVYTFAERISAAEARDRLVEIYD